MPNVKKVMMGAAGSGGAVGTRNLFVFGKNQKGQLGLGDTSTRSSPVQLGATGDWERVALGGYTTMLINPAGELFMTGFNDVGQLGLGDTTDRSSPVQVGSLNTWATGDISAYSGHTMAVKTDGTMWAWGRNHKGQLGLGDLTDRSSPVQVGSLTNWSQVAVMNYSTLAIKTDGTMWAWGQNTNGELAQGNTTSTSSPVQIGALTTWRQVSGGNRSGIAITTGGNAFSWGACIYGQLGQGNASTATSSPVLLTGTQGQWHNVWFMGFCAGGVKKSGSDVTMFTWGQGRYGSTGQGNTTNLSNPAQVGSLTDWKVSTREVNGVTQYFESAGGTSVMAPNIHAKSDGTLWAWGIGNNGQRGDGTMFSNTVSSPIQIGSSTNWTQAYFSNVMGAAFEY